MGTLLIFTLYIVITIGAVITTLYIGCYNILLAIGFAVLYLVTVGTVAKELK